MTREGGREGGRGTRGGGWAGPGRARRPVHTPHSAVFNLLHFYRKKSPHVERSGVKKRVLDISFLEDFTENVAVRM